VAGEPVEVASSLVLEVDHEDVLHRPTGSAARTTLAGLAAEPV